MLGADILAVAVTHISSNGVWILIGDHEFVLPYADFPWFRQATVDQILAVERPTPDHLYWPKLDVDLSVGSIKDPWAYPLVAGPRSPRPWSATFGTVRPEDR